MQSGDDGACRTQAQQETGLGKHGRRDGNLQGAKSNTRRRISHRRSNESSRPIMNRSNVTPRSATGWMACGSTMVTAVSQG